MTHSTSHTAEEWRPVAGYEGRYEVSNLGRVRSLRRGRRFLLHPWDQHGYATVSLYLVGGRESWRVHRLVLTAFVRPAEAGEHGRHLNGDSHDNRLVNLAWGSAAENAADTLRHGRHPKTRVTHCPRGHAYDADNTLLAERRDRAPSRQCRTCKNSRRRPPRPLLPGDPRHGTANGYKTYRCRCDACRAAGSAAVAQYRAKHGRKRRTSSLATAQKVGQK